MSELLSAGLALADYARECAASAVQASGDPDDGVYGTRLADSWHAAADRFRSHQPAMSIPDLLAWADRAAADLREYAESADRCGSPQQRTDAILRELDDIKHGRTQWTRAPGMFYGPCDAPGLAAL